MAPSLSKFTVTYSPENAKYVAGYVLKNKAFIFDEQAKNQLAVTNENRNNLARFFNGLNAVGYTKSEIGSTDGKYEGEQHKVELYTTRRHCPLHSSDSEHLQRL